MSAEILFIQLTSEEQAVLTVEVETCGIGPMDQPTRRQPTARELDAIASALQRRDYQFASSID